MSLSLLVGEQHRRSVTVGIPDQALGLPLGQTTIEGDALEVKLAKPEDTPADQPVRDTKGVQADSKGEFEEIEGAEVPVVAPPALAVAAVYMSYVAAIFVGAFVPVWKLQVLAVAAVACPTMRSHCQ